VAQVAGVAPPLPMKSLGVTALAVLGALGACTTGDGEGPRFIGRVVSVTPSEVCVGPSSSSPDVTCGAVPTGVQKLPEVGQCVGLFPRKLRAGKVTAWSAESLRAKYDDKECAPPSRQ
jgi:hypothetical protein